MPFVAQSVNIYVKLAVSEFRFLCAFSATSASAVYLIAEKRQPGEMPSTQSARREFINRILASN